MLFECISRRYEDVRVSCFFNSHQVDMIIYLCTFFLKFIWSRYYNLRTGKLSFKRKVPSADNFSPKLKVPSAGKVSPKLKVPCTGNCFAQTQSLQYCTRKESPKLKVLSTGNLFVQIRSSWYKKYFNSNLPVQEIFFKTQTQSH